MRLFVSLNPPHEILSELQNEQIGLLSGHQNPAHIEANRVNKEGVLLTPKSPWRKTSRESLHLTLKFLGDGISAHKAEEARNALATLEGTMGPISMECRGAGAFPSTERATVLWAGVRSEKLAILAKKIEDSLIPAGFGKDKPFSAHITIARSKFANNAAPLLEGNKERIWCEKNWVADSFSLMESIEVLGGREYKEIAKFRL